MRFLPPYWMTRILIPYVHISLEDPMLQVQPVQCLLLKPFSPCLEQSREVVVDASSPNPLYIFELDLLRLVVPTTLTHMRLHIILVAEDNTLQSLRVMDLSPGFSHMMF